jgi:hypothetical protein
MGKRRDVERGAHRIEVTHVLVRRNAGEQILEFLPQRGRKGFRMFGGMQQRAELVFEVRDAANRMQQSVKAMRKRVVGAELVGLCGLRWHGVRNAFRVCRKVGLAPLLMQNPRFRLIDGTGGGKQAYG